MLANVSVSEATSRAWRCWGNSINSRVKRRAFCASLWACHSANAWPAVELHAQPKRIGGRGTPSAFFASGEQQNTLISDEDQNGAVQISPASEGPFSALRIEPLGNNSRRIVVAIPIDAPLDALWSVLTDYEHLADFLPGLAVCKIEDRWENGARLFQIGEQNLALGLKFKAKGVINVQEHPIEILSCGIGRRIDFEMIEGDFQIFKGTWKMEQESNDSLDGVAATGQSSKLQTVLTYVLDVQPKVWLPVGLVEGILSREIQNNLVCVRNEVLRVNSSLTAC
eukprot:c22991_g1_i1 orf=98-943(+)